jgi:hypothetical protein
MVGATGFEIEARFGVFARIVTLPAWLLLKMTNRFFLEMH